MPCLQGKEHRLSDHRGEKVMLCFYRHSHCPAIAHSVGKLAGNYKKLAWASKLKVITVFRTDQNYLGEGLGDGGPIAHFIKEEGAGSGAFRTGTSYPFLALADPQGSAAATFKVESKGFFWHVCDVPRFPRAVRKAIRTKEVADKSKDEAEHIPGAANLLPSEFLIDEQGVLVDVMRSRKASDTMAADRITSFLLGKEKRSAKGKKGSSNDVMYPSTCRLR